jgi:glycosyltransferase involved in cell wall biosynthesis
MNPGGNSMAKNKARKSLGIVVPVFNDWAPFDLLIAKLEQQAQRAKLTLHIFVIDDGSSEPPEPEWLLAGRHTPLDIQLVRLSHNLGHQRAIAVGLVLASRVEEIDAVVVMDADGEDQPEECRDS